MQPRSLIKVKSVRKSDIGGCARRDKRIFIALLYLWSIALLPISAWAQPTEALLKERMSFWLKHANLCDGNPSKQSEAGDKCEDGDMNLFSGLLCAAGVQDAQGRLVGCDAVARAQDKDGRWFRSPRRLLDPSIDAQEHKGNVASFSPDMGLGTQLYLVTTKDKVRGESWMAWLDSHRPCWAGNEPSCKLEIPPMENVRGLPRFCTDEPGPPQPEDTEGDKLLRKLKIDPRCSMRPGDLAELAKTRAHLSLYGMTQKDLSACADPPSGSFDDSKARFDKLERLLNITRLDNIFAIVYGGLPYVLQLTCSEASTWIRLGAEFNKPGYSQHLVAVGILHLRRMGHDDNMLKESAKRLATKDKENPFFLFLDEGQTVPVLEKILQHCPKDEAEAKNSLKSQWMWERGYKDLSPNDTAKGRASPWDGTSSLWDCLFIGNLWIQGK